MTSKKVALHLKVLFFVGVTLTLNSAWASKYGVVIGGASKNMESSQQEFARVTLASTIGLSNKGYSVTTLFGSNENKTEREKYSTDYEISFNHSLLRKIAQLFPLLIVLLRS